MCGREIAKQLGLARTCFFTTHSEERADVIISKDAFEHFSKPAEMLELMARLLKPEGYVQAAFGLTWLHPYGGHLFSVFPWSHLLFTQEALFKWRSDFKTDGGTKFSVLGDGLNHHNLKIRADCCGQSTRF